MLRRRVKSALLIDFDNVVGLVGTRNFVDSIERWIAWLEDGKFDAAGRRRELVQKRVYWNLQFEQFQESFVRLGFAALTCRSLVKHKKSSADMIIALDALESAFGNNDIDEYILFTVDTDFVPLLERLGGMDRDTVVTVVVGTASEREFSRHADIVVTVDALKSALDYRRPRKLSEEILGAALAGWERTRRGVRGLASPFRRLAERLRSLGRRGLRASPSDLSVAGDHVAELARATPGLLLGRKTVGRWLTQRMPQFATDGPGRFLGFDSYTEMIEKMLQGRADLELVRHPNGGIAIRAPARDEAN